MYKLIRPGLFLLSPSLAHSVGLGALSLVDSSTLLQRVASSLFVVRDQRLEVRKKGLVFANPIGIAGGFDKDARCPHALESLGFGFLELGTVTALAQEPNPSPNLFRLPADHALINRLGFPNRGATALVERLRNQRFTTPLGISIGKSRKVSVDDQAAVVDDYLSSYRTVLEVADFVVVNISSPNTANLRAMQQAEPARVLLSRLLEARGQRTTPLLVKIAPDLSDDDLMSLLEVVRTVGLDGVVATNTTLSREGLRTPRATVESIGNGGLSGPPLRERALSFVAKSRAHLGNDALIIGVGGISEGAHVDAFRKAGADLCQLYTGFIYEGPAVARTLCLHLLK